MLAKFAIGHTHTIQNKLLTMLTSQGAYISSWREVIDLFKEQN